MDIIIDRKKKRWTNDFNEKDPLGLGKDNKKNEIPVERNSLNPIHRFLEQYSLPKLLVGKTAYCLKGDTVVSGKIKDVYAPDMFHLHNKGVFYFKDCVSLEV